jgi:hypothetical protein
MIYLLLIPATLAVAIFIVGPKRAWATTKAAFKERFGLILILILFTSCGPGSYFEPGTYEPPRDMYMYFTVDTIQDDTATLTTPHFEVEYMVDSKDLVIDETYFFFLSVWHCDNCRSFRATIIKKFDKNDIKGIRTAMRHRHL